VRHSLVVCNRYRRTEENARYCFRRYWFIFFVLGESGEQLILLREFIEFIVTGMMSNV